LVVRGNLFAIFLAANPGTFQITEFCHVSQEFVGVGADIGFLRIFSPTNISYMRILPLLAALFLGLIQPCFSQIVPLPAIAIDQIGYYPDAPKYAVVTRPAAKDAFFVVTTGANSAFWEERVDTVFFGRLGPVIASANSSLSTRLADFSALRRPGNYRLIVPGFPNSAPFKISAGVFSPVAAATLKGYYYQRSAMALTPAYAGRWSRPAGHPDDQVMIHSSAADVRRPEGTVIPASGGWYDAGDYNKYIVNSGVTMGTLLDAWEDFPVYFDTLHTNIPPIAGVPDILNEALYNLRWMLQMQDPGDGGVYHKCTNAAFDGMVMPGVTKAPRYVVQKGTAATLDFAAVMAQAARIFSGFPSQLPGLADSCRRGAIRAWRWAQQYPDSVYNQYALNKVYKPAITTGAYGDRYFEDERFWAACELWVTTQDTQYYPVVARHLADAVALPSWAYVAMMGDLTLLRHARARTAGGSGVHGKGLDSLDVLQKRVLNLADTFVRRLNGSAFHTVMGESRADFVWGSNSVAANQGMVLVNAWLQKHDTAYLNAALGNLDYLLGRNATGYCFVTGLGSHSPMHPHHRQSVADTVAPPVPGLLVGGPNPSMEDRQTYSYKEPETAYLDNDQAYASNEIAINWNAPLVYLAGAFEALQYKSGYAQPGQVAPPAQPGPPAEALQPMLHPLTRDRSGLYHGIFPIGGTFSEQILLNTNGSFVYYKREGGKADTAVGNYQLVQDKLYLSYRQAGAAFPHQFYRYGKKLYRADERGRRVKRMPGVTGRRALLLFGSRKRKYYLELTAV
jgi:endoglucanase